MVFMSHLSLVNLERIYSFTFAECSSTFRVRAWLDIMYKDISLLWEHYTFTKYFNIMDNITLVFCTIHATIYFSLKRDASAANGFTDLHTYRRFYSTLNTLSMIFLILFAPNTTMTSIVMTLKYRLM